MSALKHPYLDAVTPVAVAHRGGALLAANAGLENSLLAFRNTVALGYDYIETDVHASSDGVAFVFHDDDLDRVTDRRGRIRDLPAAEVRRARINGTEPMLDLASMLEEFPDTRFSIDIKADNALEPTVKTLVELGVEDRVCVASFSSVRLQRVRQLAPTLATACTYLETAVLRLAPMRVAQRWLSARTIILLAVPRSYYGIPVVTPGFLDRAHHLGLQVHVWTINDRSEMVDLLDMGVDGIVTDAVDVLRELLIERGEWPHGNGFGHSGESHTPPLR